MRFKKDELKYFKHYKTLFTLKYRKYEFMGGSEEFEVELNSEEELYEWINDNIIGEMYILEIKESKVYDESAICGTCDNYQAEWCNKCNSHMDYFSESCKDFKSFTR